jgi:acyl-coenzyme A thioesterase PaaI-like protein
MTTGPDGLSYVRAGVTLRASAEVLKAGNRIGHVRVDVRDAADRLVATGETTHAVVPAPSSERSSG